MKGNKVGLYLNDMTVTYGLSAVIIIFILFAAPTFFH